MNPEETVAEKEKTDGKPAAGWRDGVPGNFLGALALVGGFMAFVAWDQSHWWRVKEDYSFGWLVPVFAAYIVYDRWEQIVARLRAAAEAPPAARWVRWTLNAAAGLGLLSGALFFLLGAFYRAGAGTSHPGTLALTLGMGAIVLSLLFFNVPASAEAMAGTPTNGGPVSRPAAAGQPLERLGVLSLSNGETGPPSQATGFAALGREPRVRVAVLFLFPVLVWLISAPIVSAVENQLSLFLRHKVAVVVTFTFDLLGYPLEQQGNVLRLPAGGTVGVEDACSGIRSLTACLFAGSFLAAAFFTELWKKVFLVGASMLFAFLTNIGRGLFLTAWAYRNGADSISGAVHDAAGYAVLGVTCAGLLLLVPVLKLKFERAEPSSAN
jgi:exosortase/archaeosortase family protein